MPIRNTSATREVLEVFATSLGDEIYGLDIMRGTGIASGTIYPILQRLEGEGWLKSRWEDIDPAAEGRPARRLYSITGDGVAGAKRFETELADRRRSLARSWQQRLPQLGGGA